MATARNGSRRPRVLAIASGGGHWAQLLRLRPAFEGCDVSYASTIRGHADQVAPCRYFLVPEASRWSRLRAARCAGSVLWLLARVRPDVVVTVGALPGFFAVCFGKTVFRSRTIFMDSIANADELSMSGERSGRFADVWLTQWEHLARADGPSYAGSVLG